jgi:hypothetical protein
MDIVPFIRLPALLILLSLIAAIVSRRVPAPHNVPPQLSETIPFVSNTWQFITNKERFIDRVR